MAVTAPVRIALDRFLASVERRAFFRARLAVGNDADALDIVQDAMLKLVSNYADKPENEWRLLFNKIVETRILDWHRRQDVRNRWRLFLDKLPRSEDDDSDPNSDNSIDHFGDKNTPGVVEQMILSRSIEECAEAIQQLPLRQQQAFLLRQWEGLDVKQTADVMQCSEGSVKTHLSRALKNLRTTITEYEHGR